jgi:pimeloyl-ACP methyl ester carboxylesterase
VLGWSIELDGTHPGQAVLFDAAGDPVGRGSLEDMQDFRVRELKRLHGNGRPNLTTPTFGGKQLWGDVLVHGCYRIQGNVLTGHYRLLGPSDQRLAWGSHAACQVAFEERRLAMKSPRSALHAVVVLHGTLRSKDSLARLEAALREDGYEVIAINYPSSQATLRQIADQVRTVLNDQPGIRQVSFVSHSMGGLVLRLVCEEAKEGLRTGQPGWWQHMAPQRAVMLFPPNQGAHLAEVRQDWLSYRLIMGVSGQELTPASVATLPPSMPIPTAVFAGGRGDRHGRNWLIPDDDDGTVAVAETQLPGAHVWRRFDVSHTFGMNAPDVIDAVVAFLQHGIVPDRLGVDLLSGQPQ